MHDVLIQECQYCRHFCYPFPENGPLADWGYCALERKGKPAVSEQEAVEMQEEVRQGDRRRLLDGRFGLYKLEADDGCDLFTPWDDDRAESEDKVTSASRGSRGGV